MIDKNRIGLVITICFLIIAVGCAKSKSSSLDSESHFLESCNSSCPDGFSCVCGVCTVVCGDHKTCTGLNPNATCLVYELLSETFHCPEEETVEVCDIKCTSDKQCSGLSAEHECHNGFCRDESFQDPSQEQNGNRFKGGSTIEMDAGIEILKDTGTINKTDATIPTAPSALNATLLCEEYLDDAGVVNNQEVGPDMVPTCAEISGSEPIKGAASVASLGDIGMVFVTSLSVYWCNRDGIVTFESNGSDLITVIPRERPNFNCTEAYIQVDNSDVYWTSADPSPVIIHKGSFQTGEYTVLANLDARSPRGLTGDEEYLYWAAPVKSTDPYLCNIYRTPKEPGETTILAESLRCMPSASSSSVILIGERLYWLADSSKRELADGALMSMHNNGTESPVAEVIDLGNPSDIAFDTTHIYWTNRGTWDSLGNHRGNGTVMRMNLSDRNLEVIAEGLTSPGAIAVDRSYLYWLLDDSDSMLVRAEKDCHSSPSVITSGLHYPSRLQMDDDFLYWNELCKDSFEHVVMKISKNYTIDD